MNLKLYLIGLTLFNLNLPSFGQSQLIPVETASAIYGKKCGFAGEAPAHRKKLEEALMSGNHILIKSWLNSNDRTLQAYGLEGCMRIKDLRENESIQIQFVKIKSDTSMIFTCAGCLYQKQPLDEVVKQIIQSIE